MHELPRLLCFNINYLKFKEVSKKTQVRIFHIQVNKLFAQKAKTHSSKSRVPGQEQLEDNAIFVKTMGICISYLLQSELLNTQHAQNPGDLAGRRGECATKHGGKGPVFMSSGLILNSYVISHYFCINKQYINCQLKYPF